MRHTRMTALVFLSGLTVIGAFAQGPGGPHGAPPDAATMMQNRVNFLTSSLSLTAAQVAQATQIFTTASTASESIRTSQQSTRQSLAAAIKKNDVATIDSLALTSGQLSGELIAIESKADAQFYAILTADQQAKYDLMPHGGPGGFGPTGFGPARNRSIRQQ